MEGDRWRRLHQTGKELCRQYEQERNLEHLSQGIGNLQEALILCPIDASQRVSIRDWLGWALQMRYNRKGKLEDLAQVIQYRQELLDLRAPGHPNRSDSLNELAVALWRRFNVEGNVEDLAHAIRYYLEALELRGPEHPDRPNSLNSLAVALWTRFNGEGNLEDLAQAIRYYLEALEIRGPGHPDRSNSLNSLALALWTRYNREGNSEDLAKAIQYHREALELRGPGHPNRSNSLNNLALALWTRYYREENLEDLGQAIQYHRAALELRGPGHPGRSDSLDNLAHALMARYGRDRNMEDLSQAIRYHREALGLHGPGHPDRPLSLNNLASALRARYDREANLEDLVQAILYYQEALDLRPPDHPYRSFSLTALSNVLHLRLRKLHTVNNSTNVAALDLGAEGVQLLNHAKHSSTDYVPQDPSTSEIVSMLREASKSPNCSPIACLKAALDWVRVSKDIDPMSVIEAYTTAFNQMDVILSLGQSLNQRQDRLLSDNLIMKTRGLGGEAVTWALQRGEPEHAVELLEQSRTLLLTQVRRYRVELDNLDKVDPDLANRFVELSRRLDESVVSNQRLDKERTATKDPYGSYRQLSIEWSMVVDEIRALPNFETFLKPASFDQLQDAAAEGPVIIIIPNENASDALILHNPPSEAARVYHVPLPLAKADRLIKLSDNFTKALSPENDRGNRMEGLCLPLLRSLWKEVVEPVAQALQNDLRIQAGSRVWWCPTSVACSLPLHAAGMYSKGQGNFPNLYTSSYTPTIQALIRARQSRHASGNMPKKLLVVLQSAAAPDSLLPAALDRSQPIEPDDQSRLQCAVHEAEVIVQTLSQTWDVKTLSGEEGTRETVQLEMDSHPWVHFICHGNQVEDHPLDSYLSLYAGPLTLHKMIERKLPNADFAFLAACHSAAGDRALANEVLHLAAAMQFAGFRSVIGTLWKMRDEDGPPLAEAFYREMLHYEDGRGAAVALNTAFKKLRLKDGEPRVSINGLMRFVHIGT